MGEPMAAIVLILIFITIMAGGPINLLAEIIRAIADIVKKAKNYEEK